MEFKGTKGKWYWIPSHGNRLAILENEYGFEICNFGDSEQYYPTEGLEPNEYDKKLISCAPEMLEMLHKCKQAFESLKQPFISSEIEQLIKKATEI